jgi:mevalonate kinase
MEIAKLKEMMVALEEQKAEIEDFLEIIQNKDTELVKENMRLNQQLGEVAEEMSNKRRIDL